MLIFIKKIIHNCCSCIFGTNDQEYTELQNSRYSEPFNENLILEVRNRLLGYNSEDSLIDNRSITSNRSSTSSIELMDQEQDQEQETNSIYVNSYRDDPIQRTLAPSPTNDY